MTNEAPEEFHLQRSSRDEAAMAATLTSESFWGHYFLAWLAKLLILRYGGMRLYRAALPFVFGMILGDIASQTLWSIGASLLDAPVYRFVS